MPEKDWYFSEAPAPTTRFQDVMLTLRDAALRMIDPLHRDRKMKDRITTSNAPGPFHGSVDI